jgi:hypothetical protein
MSVKINRFFTTNPWPSEFYIEIFLCARKYTDYTKDIVPNFQGKLKIRIVPN